jgi:type IV pilus assembly protein PilC
MPVYSFEAIDARGKRRSGSVEAESIPELEKRLDSQGMAVLDIRGGGKLASSHEVLNPDAPSPRKVPNRDVIEFFIFMGTLLESGVPISTALRDFAKEARNPWFRQVLQTLLDGVESGTTLSAGMAGFPKIFSNEVTHLIRAGEQTGTLPRAFNDLRTYMEWRENLAGDIKQATTYPLVIVIAVGAFILYLFTFVIPKIAKILIDLGLQLPMITKVVLFFSNLALHYGWIIPIVGVATPFLLKFGSAKSPEVGRGLDLLKLKIPVFGPMLHMIFQARFTHNFAVMHRAGIPILENLELCSQLMGNRIYAEAVMQACEDIRNGGNLSDSLRDSKLFSALVLRMVAAGESTGRLDESLTHAAKYYDAEVPRVVKKVFSVIEPMIILTLVGVVGTVALAIFLPILSISGGLK